MDEQKKTIPVPYWLHRDELPSADGFEYLPPSDEVLGPVLKPATRSRPVIPAVKMDA